jgi:hypothetical protein
MGILHPRQTGCKRLIARRAAGLEVDIARLL